MHSLRFPKTKDQKDQKHPPHFWLAKLAFWTSLPCWCLASRGSLRQESASRAESSHAGTLFEDTRLRFEQDYTGILPICISFSHLAQCVPKAEMLIGLDLQQQKIIQRSPASLRTPIFVSQPRHKARSRVAIPACAAKAFASCTSSAQSSASMFSYHVSGRWSLEASGMLARKLLYARCTSKASRALLSHPMQGCVCVCSDCRVSSFPINPTCQLSIRKSPNPSLATNSAHPLTLRIQGKENYDSILLSITPSQNC